MSTDVHGSATEAARPQTRRERQREATYDEITRTSRALLAEGAELSLRAVASRMGMTAPALYRYVASYQELVDLVAFEIDKAATERFAAAADQLPEDDYAGRLVVSATEFRMWALGSPREFGMVFANPIAEAACTRREMLTQVASGHLMTGQMRALWEHNHHPNPGEGGRPAPGGPWAGVALPAGLDDAVRRGGAGGLRPHGPAGHRVR
jgi:AcrR family transcriptional regulator